MSKRHMRGVGKGRGVENSEEWGNLMRGRGWSRE